VGEQKITHLGDAPGFAPELRCLCRYARRKESFPVGTQEDEKQIFTAPGVGTHLPVLDIVHKVTADRSGGSLTVEEWGLPQA
jgi:hypothetical protein